MAQVGTAWVLITPSFVGFNKAINGAVSSTMPAAGAAAGSQMGRGISKGVGASGPAIGAAAGRAGTAASGALLGAGTAAGHGFTARAGAALAKGGHALTGATSRLAHGMSSAFSSAGAGAGAGFLGGAAASLSRVAGPLTAIFGGGAILGSGFGRLAGIEDAQAKLKGLGHDAQSVQTIMDNALASVKGTAFSMGDAATISAGAVAAGIKPGKELQRVLGLTGDTATIAGSSLGEMGAIFNKVAASNRLSMSEVNQLSDRGIPIMQWLGEQYGVTALEARKMVESGQVDFAAFSEAIETNIAGAALKSGETTRGSFANMKAALSRFGADLLSGIFPRLAGGFQSMTAVIDRGAKQIEPMLARMSGFLRDNAAWLKPLAAGVAGAAAAFVALKAILMPVRLAIGLVNLVLAANPITLVVLALGALVGVAIYAYKNFETFRSVVDTAWAGIRSATSFAWDKVIKPAFSALSGFVTGTLVPVITGLWQNTVKPTFEALGSFVKSTWDRVLRPTFDALVAFVKNPVATTIDWLWKGIVKPAFDAIGWIFSAWWAAARLVFDAAKLYVEKVLAPVVTWLWKNVFAPAFDAIGFLVKAWWEAAKLVFDILAAYVRNVLAPVVTWLWKNVFAPVFEGIGATVSWVWDHVIKPVFSALGSFIETHVAPAFRRGVDAIGSAWDSIREIAAKPVNFVIETVYNNGIRAAFEKVAKAVGSDARLPVMEPVKFRAKGGFTPAGWTVVGEEGPELVDFRTPGRVYTAQETAAMREPGTGGPVDWLTDTASAAVRKGTDIVRGAASMLLDPFEWVRQQVAGLVSRIPGAGAFGGIVKAVPGKLLDALKNKLGSFFGGEGGIGGASGPGGWQWQMAVLRQAFPGLPLNSGYRPGAITATGNPSMHGLGRAVDLPPRMDVFNWIRSAFGANSKELIFSPAGGRQLKNGQPHTYTGVTKAMHYDHVHWGYDQGGWLPPGVSQVMNATGKPEAILNPQQWADVSRLARQGVTSIGADMPELIGAVRDVADRVSAVEGRIDRLPAGYRLADRSAGGRR